MSPLYQRTLQASIEQALGKGKIIVIYGARQVGKTTLVQRIAQSTGKEYRYLNADELDVRE